MHINHSNHHFAINKSLHSKMNKIYFYQTLLTFTKSMIGLFLPVYLYKLGFSLITILLFYVGYSIVYLSLIPISIKYIKKIGFKYTIISTIPIYLTHIISINFINGTNLFFHLSWLTYGIYISFFWPAMHSELAINGSKKHRGSQIGTLQILLTMAGTIAPIIGGIFLDTLSYTHLFIFASIIILIGSIPLMLSKEVKLNNFEFKYKDYFRLIKEYKKDKSKLAFISEGFENVLNILIWPILVFIFLNQSFIKLGTLLTIVSVISILVMVYFKSYIDKHNKNKVLNIITKFLALNWFFKSFVLLFGSIFLYEIESIYKILKNTLNISYFSIFYNNAKKKKYMDYIILRELYLHATKIIFTIVIVIPIILIFGETLNTMIAMIALGIFIPIGFSYLKEL